MTRETGPDGDAQDALADDIGTVIGTVDDVYLDDDAARGTVRLGDFSTVVPGLGNVRDYVLKLATEHPELLGMSAVFAFSVEPAMDATGNVSGVAARIEALEAVDIVGKGAAVDNGLLSARNAVLFDPQPGTPPGWPAPNDRGRSCHPDESMPGCHDWRSGEMGRQPRHSGKARPTVPLRARGPAWRWLLDFVSTTIWNRSDGIANRNARRSQFERKPRPRCVPQVGARVHAIPSERGNEHGRTPASYGELSANPAQAAMIGAAPFAAEILHLRKAHGPRALMTKQWMPRPRG